MRKALIVGIDNYRQMQISPERCKDFALGGVHISD